MKEWFLPTPKRKEAPDDVIHNICQPQVCERMRRMEDRSSQRLRILVTRTALLRPSR
jgi:hypothetical protein